ncbi:MAG: hypothetical protein EXS46_00540 [Candidatus Taylorbacteria bacterium]|nr:hypothetical protein [Candidatus Taylorbacteria bacterium]
MKMLNDLVVLIWNTIDLCQKKFANPNTGIGPSFLLSVTINSDGKLMAYYLPILNHWGFTEFDKLAYGMGKFTLPWPHIDTWRYLTDTDEPDGDLLLDKQGGWKALVGGIRAGQVFFVKETADYHKLHLEKQVTSGGTRCGVELIRTKMRRAWGEGNLTHLSSQACSFCSGEVLNPINVDNLIVFDNQGTPHPWHKMIVPNKRWLESNPLETKTQLLPLPMLSEILELILVLCGERKYPNLPVQFGIHAGTFGGQNMPHPHAHLLQVDPG